jgi:hypothetical protein
MLDLTSVFPCIDISFALLFDSSKSGPSRPWQKSPIPVLPSDIAPISTESRAKDPVGLAPTAFPQSVVNIQAPQALPDPVGLAAALKVLGTPNIFGDYSLGKETAALLQKLSDNATVMAKVRVKCGLGPVCRRL